MSRVTATGDGFGNDSPPIEGPRSAGCFRVGTAVDHERLTELLGEIGFSAALPERVRAALADIAELREFRAGDVVFSEGDLQHDVYLIVSGSVALDMHVPGRGPVRILSIGPGELLAWSALVGTGQMTAAATALEETEALVLPGPDVRRLCESDHEFGYLVMRRTSEALSRRLLATRLQLLDLFRDLETPAEQGTPQSEPSAPQPWPGSLPQ